MLVRILVVLPVLGLAALFFEMGAIWGTIWILLLLVMFALGLAYAVANIRNQGEFSCQLTEEDFTQSIPVPSCGESFQIRICQITQIEIHDGGGEGPSDEWYLHTKDGRHRITANYGNPYRKFGEAIQRALPQIETVRTRGRNR